MDKLKGFNESSELQQQKSILIDIGLIIEFGSNYKEYLESLFFEPMNIKLNLFVRKLHSMKESEIEKILQQL